MIKFYAKEWITEGVIAVDELSYDTVLTVIVMVVGDENNLCRPSAGQITVRNTNSQTGYEVDAQIKAEAEAWVANNYPPIQ